MTQKYPNKTGAVHSISRRNLLIGAAAGSASSLSPAGAEVASGKAGTADESARAYVFYGNGPQAGIMTPPQRHIFYMTFDLTTNDRDALRALLARWSAAIAQMMKGETIGQVEPARAEAVAPDTGEALNLGPSGLTVTIGLGPDVFTDRFGLAEKRPALFRPLMQLPSDALRPELTGGDLSLQACADDPQVTYHAIRDLVRIAKNTGTAATRWTVMGFGRASAGKGQSTPRNLFGFKDGTRNIVDPSDFDEFVWIKEGPEWQIGGTYQVARKVQMQIENWDTNRVSHQNAVFGRHKLSGAPLGGRHEFDIPDFTRRGRDGELVIPKTAHISLAAHENNGGIRILRRSYNYTDGLNDVGLLDAGLLFISYQNDPAHFEALQMKLGAADALNEYITHIGSALFFVPPAAIEGTYVGAAVFD